MDEGEHPRARLAALGAEARSAAPDGQERLLHRVLGEPVVAQDAHREAVGDAPDAVVQLAESALVPTRHEGDEGFVGEVSVLPSHRRAGLDGER